MQGSYSDELECKDRGWNRSECEDGVGVRSGDAIGLAGLGSESGSGLGSEGLRQY